MGLPAGTRTAELTSSRLGPALIQRCRLGPALIEGGKLY